MSSPKAGADIWLDTAALDSLVRLHGATLKQTRKAEERALRKLHRWLVSRIKRRFAEVAEMPQRVVGPRIHHRYLKEDGLMSVWIGLNPVAAHRAGRVSGGLSRRSAGASVSSRSGRRFFRGAFQASIYSDERQVFIRRHSPHFDPGLYPYDKRRQQRDLPDELRGRFPVVLARIEIAEAVEKSVFRDQAAIQKKMQDLFEHELKIALGIIETQSGRVKA